MRRPKSHIEEEIKGEWTASVWIMQQQGLDCKGRASIPPPCKFTKSILFCDCRVPWVLATFLCHE